VQTITSSVDFVTGSAKFGSIIDNTHQFTGSVLISGSQTTNGAITATGNIRTYRIGGSSYIQMNGEGGTGNFESSNGYYYFNRTPGDYSSPNLMIDGANNRVGIGTTNPSEKLEISGNIKLGGTSTYNSIAIYNSGSSGGGGMIAYKNGTAQAFFGASAWYTGGTDNGAIIGTDSSSIPIIFHTSAERMRVTGGGNVGIGITNPSYKLDVSGTGRFTDTLIVKNTSSSPSIWSGQYGGAINILGDNTTSNRYIDLSIVDSNGANSVSGLRLVSGGNVGIGITNPTTSKLEVNGTTTIYSTLNVNAAGTYSTNGNALNIESNSWAIVDANVKRQMQRVIGYVGDYEQHVILLHPIYNGTLVSFCKAYGTIHASRGATYAGRISDTYEIDTSTGYNSYNGTLKSNTIQGRLYTCTYGGVKYLALIPGYRTSAVMYHFDGYIANNIGGETLKLVTYRMSNSGTVVNSEINNSLAEYTENDTFTNGLFYPRQGVRFNSGATTLNYYEEGDFSVTYDGGSGGLTVLYTNWAKYTRVGNMVHVDMSAQVTATSTGKQYFVFRLPINFSSTTGYGPRGIVSNYNLGNNSGASSNVGIALRNTSGNLYQIYVEAVFTSTGTTDMAVSITYKA
jgi:hypothetical protein